ncbi:hypothetical protein [Paraburkholderia sp. GAS348]|uniref:hypothetical protein n=1 Tax=Paraburkholderia sp. GAS348 TaxID=3035132 RepID=UPI003D1CEC0F
MKQSLISCAINLLAFFLAAIVLNGCGGKDPGVPVSPAPSPNAAVPGTATPVPGTDVVPAVAPSNGSTNIPESAGLAPASNAARFTSVAPATTEQAAFQSSPAIAYDLGNLTAQSGIDNHVFITPVRGWVRYPLASTSVTKTSTRFPIVIFLHGQHDPTVPSYQGYDYLAQDLATQGYVAISIDANAINGSAGNGDASSRSRAQLVLGTLDRLRDIDKRGGPGMLDQLKDKLDFTRVGIMGHSRGGQGVANTLKYNITRVGVTDDDLKAALLADPSSFNTDYPDLAAAVIDTAPGTRTIDTPRFQAALWEYNIFGAAGAESTPPYNFKAALMLAPTDFSGNLGLNNVALAVLLPSCDGDMADLEGARTFDHNRFGFDTDMAPRYQILVRGANHNFFNTIWTDDDYPSTNATDYCANRPDGIRLSAQDQRRGGQFLVNSFMRRFVGDEQQFAAYWNGTAQLPEAACPEGKGPCDSRTVLSVQKSAAFRTLVQRFERNDSLRRNDLGGAIALSGFDSIANCRMPFGDSDTVGICTPERLPAFEYSGPHTKGLLSIADHLELSWFKPNATLITVLGGMSASAYDSLTFRIAIVRPAGQEVLVTMTDTTGHSATVNASDFSDALYLGPQPKADGRPMTDDPTDAPFAAGGVAQLLNMIAIPLAAFPGVDSGSLSQLKLTFPKAIGKVAVTDIEFQKLGRP